MQRSGDLRLPAERLPGAVGPGSVRVDAITHVPEVLGDLGLDPDVSIAAAGLPPAIFSDPQNEVSMAGLGRLLGLAVERSGCGHVGLLVGERAELTSLGLIGLLTRHAPDVGTALRDLTVHSQLRDRGGVGSLAVANGMASLGYEIYQPEVEAVDQLCDGVMAMAANFVRSLCGAEWRPARVLFAHSRPADLGAFRRVFGAPLHFDSERHALVFPARWLGHRTPGADPALYRELLGSVVALEASMDSDLVAELRRMLRVILPSGKGSVGEVAERLSMHRRTLNRRLRARGTSLHRLVEQTRYEIAFQLVRGTRMPLTEIAAALGYGDASAFTRAFRRWSGSAPSAWRKPAPLVAKCQAVPTARAYAASPRNRRTRRGG